MMEEHKSFSYARYFRIRGYPLFVFTIHLICLEVSGKNIIFALEGSKTVRQPLRADTHFLLLARCYARCHSDKTKDECQKAQDLCILSFDLILLTLWQNILTRKQT
jgi:hypothetical protein